MVFILRRPFLLSTLSTITLIGYNKPALRISLCVGLLHLKNFQKQSPKLSKVLMKTPHGHREEMYLLAR